MAIHYRSAREEAESAAKACPGSVLLQADLSRSGAAEGLVAAAFEALGGLDCLVNNASEYAKRPLEGLDEAAFDLDLATNLRAPFFCALAAGRKMRGGPGGVIVNLTDAAVDRPDPRYLPYFAAKAALRSMTAGLARAFAPRVRVNAVAPGPVLLPEGAPAELKGAIERALPLGALGGAEPVVSAVLFLVRNDFVTGQTVVIDGGRSLR